MTSSKPGPDSSDRAVRLLLERYRCPMPFHELRMLFMGTIASPRPNASPIACLERAWGGELPEFESLDAAQAVLGTLVQGFWNRMTQHQSGRNPIRLARFEVLPTRVSLRELATVRVHELKGFVDGLFGEEPELALPDKAHEAMQRLSEIYAMMAGAEDLLSRDAVSADPRGLKELLRNLQRLTIAADEQINRIVQSCQRARGQMQQAMASTPAPGFVGQAPRSGNEQEEQPLGQDLDDDDPGFVDSPLSRTITRHGVTVEVQIHGEPGEWLLEIVDAQRNSHVWDDRFESDRQALEEALRALEEEPLEFFGPGPGSSVN